MNTQRYSNMIGQLNLLNLRLAYSNTFTKILLKVDIFKLLKEVMNASNQRGAGTDFKHMVRVWCHDEQKSHMYMGTK